MMIGWISQHPTHNADVAQMVDLALIVSTPTKPAWQNGEVCHHDGNCICAQVSVL